ncbi:MAG: tetratricopeptide repeat protein [Motiliproteus sp.]
MIEGLEKLLMQGKESAELRFGLGNAYLGKGDAAVAVSHLRRAIELKPEYSAAWKLLAKALQQSDQNDAAIEAYRLGIAVAQKVGDKQAEKEMQVFLNRLLR